MVLKNPHNNTTKKEKKKKRLHHNRITNNQLIINLFVLSSQVKILSTQTKWIVYSRVKIYYKLSCINFWKMYMCQMIIFRKSCCYPLFNNIQIVTTAHPWYDGHSTSISACGVWGGKGQGSSLLEGVSHTYTHRLG